MVLLPVCFLYHVRLLSLDSDRYSFHHIGLVMPVKETNVYIWRWNNLLGLHKNARDVLVWVTPPSLCQEPLWRDREEEQRFLRPTLWGEDTVIENYSKWLRSSPIVHSFGGCPWEILDMEIPNVSNCKWKCWMTESMQIMWLYTMFRKPLF